MENKKPTSKKVLIAILIIVVILISFGIYFLVKSKKENPDKKLIDSLKDELKNVKDSLTKSKEEAKAKEDAPKQAYEEAKQQQEESVKGNEDVFSGSDISPLNPCIIYSDYNQPKYSILLPGYPVGVLVNENGASNYLSILDKFGETAFVEKSNVKF